MGLERLVALLNNSTSNYDTDLFTPIFSAIERTSKRPAYSGKFGSQAQLDTHYRILADHARMITMCLSDRVSADQNHKLKNVLRRAFKISQNIFGVRTGMLQELYNPVAETLGDAYPEIVHNKNTIQMLLEYEEENFLKLIANSKKSYSQLEKLFPVEANQIDLMESCNFYNSLKALDSEIEVDGNQKNLNNRELTTGLAFKLYESHGMQEKDLIKLADIRRLNFDIAAFQHHLTLRKQLSKIGSSSQQAANMGWLLGLAVEDSGATIPPTDDSFKYLYRRTDDGQYQFDSCLGQIVTLVG